MNMWNMWKFYMKYIVFKFPHTFIHAFIKHITIDYTCMALFYIFQSVNFRFKVLMNVCIIVLNEHLLYFVPQVFNDTIFCYTCILFSEKRARV